MTENDEHEAVMTRLFESLRDRPSKDTDGWGFLERENINWIVIWRRGQVEFYHEGSEIVVHMRGRDCDHVEYFLQHLTFDLNTPDCFDRLEAHLAQVGIVVKFS